jgi:hypothetical protein
MHIAIFRKMQTQETRDFLQMYPAVPADVLEPCKAIDEYFLGVVSDALENKLLQQNASGRMEVYWTGSIVIPAKFIGACNMILVRPFSPSCTDFTINC